MSTVHVSLGKANWYVSEPDWSVAQAEELTGKRQTFMKARVILSLPHIAPKLRVAAHSMAAATIAMGVTVIGVLAIA